MSMIDKRKESRDYATNTMVQLNEKTKTALSHLIQYMEK